MTIDYTKPALPDYLTTAMKHAGDMMDENRRIDYAISSVEERLSAITQEIPALEDTLGDMEADALLKRRPDNAKLSKTQDELQALHAEQRKLQSAAKYLRCRWSAQVGGGDFFPPPEAAAWVSVAASKRHGSSPANKRMRGAKPRHFANDSPKIRVRSSHSWFALATLTKSWCITSACDNLRT